MSWPVSDPADSARGLALLFAAALRVTVLLALAAGGLAAARRRAAGTHAGVIAGALLAILLLPAARGIPLFWKAPILDGLPATVMVALGSAEARRALASPAELAADGEAAGFLATHWPSLLVIVWGLGCAAVLAGVARAMLGVRRLARAAAVVDDPAWRGLLDAAAAGMGVRTRVRLLRHPAVGTPLTWGVRHPTIVLPDAADTWPVEHRRAALLHELAHVRRRDCLFQLLARTACAVYWFHPAVWWFARRLWFERERACDDRVLAAGVRPSVYAECLLRAADAARGRGRAHAGVLAVSAGIARPSRLKARLDAVLDDRIVRRPPSRALVRAALAAGVCAWLPVGTSRLSPRAHVLVDALRADAWGTRAYAARALERLGDPRATPALAAAAAHDPCANVRARAASALAASAPAASAPAASTPGRLPTPHTGAGH